jgi:pyruvate decarboxylase
MSQLQEPIELTLYLFRRLRQIGIRSLHGVPGDYNLKALDYLTAADLHWVENCNELNGGKIKLIMSHPRAPQGGHC